MLSNVFKMNLHFLDSQGFQENLHPLTYALKWHDRDTPTYVQAMTGEDADEYYLAMAKEVHQLEEKQTWQIVDHTSICDANVLPGTWVFKCKRLPNGTIRKYKARFCVRGDTQVEGIDFFNMYAPAVSWPVIHLLLTLSIVLNLATEQVDYVNAFAQVDVDYDIYVTLPIQNWTTERTWKCT